MALFKAATTQSSGGGETSKYKAPLLDAGGYPARLVRIVDLGLQPPGPMGKVPKPKMSLVFECLDEFMLDEDDKEVADQPRDFTYDVAYEEDGYMTDRHNIYKVMQALDGFNKNLEDLLDTPVTISLDIKETQDKSKKYNVITSVTAMREKDQLRAPASKMEKYLFSLDADATLEQYEKLSSRGGKWSQKELIKSALDLHKQAPQLAAALKVEKVPQVGADTVADAATQEDVFVDEPAGAVAQETAEDPFE